MEQGSLFDQRDIYTPSRLNREAREHLEGRFRQIWIEGEVSNLSRPASGHLYFTLKDDRAQVRCALFRSRGREVGFEVTDGMQVLARGRVSLYEPRGDYQLIVDQLEDSGEGRLRRLFEELKKRLDSEGLFAPEHKKPLPRFPRRIAIVTSPAGAAIQDVLSVLERRFPCVAVTLVPSLVQGEQAPGQLVRGLERAVATRPDVILLTRGGGSLEDLWAFNDERLARAIHACPVPLVAAVGHEIDFTIAEFAADVRAPTPSAAAELLVPDARELIQSLITQRARIERAQRRCLQQRAQRVDEFRRILDSHDPRKRLAAGRERLAEFSHRQRQAWRIVQAQRQTRLNELNARLLRQSPLAMLRERRARLGFLDARIRRSIAGVIERARMRLAATGKALNSISPLAVLERGYSLTRREDGRIVRRAAELAAGDTLDTRLHEGTVRSRVLSTETPD